MSSFLGGVNEFEMLRTFNCSVGGILVVNKEFANEIVNLIQDGATIIGEIVKFTGNDSLCVFSCS